MVAPSLPGYGFSEPPRTPGWDEQRIAHAFVALMDRLGYDRYGAQGGDWGAQVTTRIGRLDPKHCAAIHLNMALGYAARGRQPAHRGGTSGPGRDAAVRAARSRATPTSKAPSRRLSASALNDSPAGLLAWIVEKFRSWSDCDGDPENCFTRDQLITNVMLYWVTQTSTSSARLYWESRHAGPATEALPFVDVPTGVARYPKEILRWPRSWVERQYNVVHWAGWTVAATSPPWSSPSCSSTISAPSSGRALTSLLVPRGSSAVKRPPSTGRSLAGT